MATLTETAYFARKGVNIGIILLVAFIVLRIIIGFTVSLWQQLFPKPPAPPTLAFGKLPYPNGLNNNATPSGVTYSLQTNTGSAPTLPPTVKVFLIQAPPSSFSAFDQMKSQAGKLGFTNNPQKLTASIWEFKDPSNNLRTLDIDEVTGNFHLSYNYLSDQSLFNARQFTSTSDLITQAQSFFSSQGDLTDDLKKGTPTLVYLKLNNGALETTTSLSNADAVAVTLNRSDIEKIPVLSPDQKQGLVSVIISGSGDQTKKIIDARYFYLPVDLQNLATYPPITFDQALSNLKAGKAIYASLPNPTPKQITIRTVSLSYLVPYPSQPYLQPILVFSDEKGFIAYVPAVSPTWLQ